MSATYPHLLHTAGFAALSALLLPVPAFGQAQQEAPASAQAGQPAPVDYGDDAEEILVIARSDPGAIIGDIPPENQLDSRTIASYGVGTISELLEEIAPQTQSDQGREGGGPVILVNGRRVSGVDEVSDLPAETILRLDILPEEVALKYGYSAEQKVVNIILRRRFRSVTVNVDGGMATEGQGERGNFNATLTRIRDNERLNISARVQTSAAILESERGIRSDPAGTPYDLVGNVVAPGGGEIDPALSAIAGQPVTIAGAPAGLSPPGLADFAPNSANLTDDTPYRTLSPSQRTYSLNGVLARPLSDSVQSSLNLRLRHSRSKSLDGLADGVLPLPAGNPYSPFGDTVNVLRFLSDRALEQQSRSTDFRAATTINADLPKSWRLSFTGAYDHVEADTRTERDHDLATLREALQAGDPAVDPFGALPPALLGPLLVERARSSTDSGNASFLVNGPVTQLPAGPLRTSLKLEARTSQTTSSTIGAVTIPRRGISRSDADAQLSIDLPITRRGGFLGEIGTLTANVNGAVTEVSGYGTLETVGYGLSWTPTPGISLIASVNEDRRAPTARQLNDPISTRSNVRVFDYATGQSALVTRTSGGNPLLEADDRRVVKLGATVKPFGKVDLSLTANYFSSRIRDVIASLPGASADIEAAFPDRFERNAQGELVAIDARPVNFASQDREQIRWGLNFTHVLREPRRPARPQGAGQPGGGQAAQASGGRAPDMMDPAAGEQQPDRPAGTEARPDSGLSPFAAGRDSDDRQSTGSFGADPGRGFGAPGAGARGSRGRGGDNGARLQLSLYHSWLLQSRVRIREGLPEIDLLDGGTLGGAAQARHQLQFNGGVTDNGVGIRLSGTWIGAAEATGGNVASAGRLRFSPLTTLDLRLFANLQQRLPQATWARGLRVTLSVDNLLNDRQQVRDALGNTPFAYQPGYLDPEGRTVSLGLRKLF